MGGLSIRRILTIGFSLFSLHLALHIGVFGPNSVSPAVKVIGTASCVAAMMAGGTIGSALDGLAYALDEVIAFITGTPGPDEEESRGGPATSG